MPNLSAPVVVTGANGFVGSRICQALHERGVPVRAIVRRSGTAPGLGGVEEQVGDFGDPGFAHEVLSGASVALTTVHPMADDRETQYRVGVQATSAFARAAVEAGVARLIHVSTAAVYDRSAESEDVDEDSALVADDANDYAVTKRDTDLALAAVEGVTRILLRPPAILGPGPSSVWNTLRPAGMRDDPSSRHAVADQTFPWVHVTDLATLAVDLATGAIPDGDDVARGPVAHACTAVNVAGPGGTQRDYFTAVTGALGVEPVWEQTPAWTGALRCDRARAWGWTPTVKLDEALAEIAAGIDPTP